MGLKIRLGPRRLHSFNRVGARRSWLRLTGGLKQTNGGERVVGNERAKDEVPYSNRLCRVKSPNHDLESRRLALL